MKYVVSLYPNRELRVVRCPSRAVGAEPCPRVVPPQIPAGGIPEASEAVPESEPGSSEVPPSPLTLHPNSEPGVRPGWGVMGRETRFGTNARRSLLRCGGVFDADSIPPGEVVFLTGTLPGGTMDAFVTLASWSSAIVDRLKSWISKHEKATYSMYVWERQKRGALHLHYAVRLSDPSARSAVLAGFKSWWYRQMCRISDDSGVDVFEWKGGAGTWRGKCEVIQADAQLCEKSISSYLAKYASKGAGKVNEGCDGEGVKMPWPVRWWGCSRHLGARCRELTKKEVFEGISWGQEKTKTEFVKGAFERGFNSSEEISKLHGQGFTADNCDDLSNIRHRYSDKAKTSEVFVGYGPNSVNVYNEIIEFFRPSKNYEPIAPGYDAEGYRIAGWGYAGGEWCLRHDNPVSNEDDCTSIDGSRGASPGPTEVCGGTDGEYQQLEMLSAPKR